jgi:hypothetical protein
MPAEVIKTRRPGKIVPMRERNRPCSSVPMGGGPIIFKDISGGFSKPEAGGFQARIAAANLSFVIRQSFKY